MRFDAFANLPVIENYYGKQNIIMTRILMANWGIWDEEFLQYTAKNIIKPKNRSYCYFLHYHQHHPL